MPESGVLGGLLENTGSNDNSARNQTVQARFGFHPKWGGKMQRGLRACKNLAFWDIYDKKDDKLSGAIISLRCPYWSIDCEHREMKDNKAFCRNFPMHDEIRKEFRDKQDKEIRKNKDEPPDDKELKKAA